MLFIKVEGAPDTQPGAEKESLPGKLEGAWGRKPRKANGPLLRSGAPLRVPRMGCPRRKALSVLLILVPVYLHGASSQRASPAGQRKPCFERLRRLEERINVPTTWGSCVSNSTADIEPYVCCSGDTNRERGVLSISDSTVPYSWQPAEKVCWALLGSQLTVRTEWEPGWALEQGGPLEGCWDVLGTGAGAPCRHCPL